MYAPSQEERGNVNIPYPSSVAVFLLNYSSDYEHGGEYIGLDAMEKCPYISSFMLLQTVAAGTYLHDHRTPQP